MKKVLIWILALVMVLGLAGCSSKQTEATEGQTADTKNQETLENYPIVGTWQAENDDGHRTYLRIMENGGITPEFVLERKTTTTVNGVTKSFTSKYIQTAPTVPWKIQGENFMYNGLTPYKMTFDGVNYKLIGKEITYVRIGNVDYEIALDDTTDDKGSTAKTTPYTIGEVLNADGIEMTFTESAINSERDFRKTQQKISNNIENSLQMIA